MASKEFPQEKAPSKKGHDAESIISNDNPPESGKLVRQLKNRHISMIRYVHQPTVSTRPKPCLVSVVSLAQVWTSAAVFYNG